MGRFFCVKQKAAYEVRSSGWSSDVCASDLTLPTVVAAEGEGGDVGKLELDPRARREAAGVKDILAVEDVDAKTFALIAIAHGDVHRGAVGQTASNVSRCIDGVGIAVSGLDARRDRTSVGSGKQGSVRVDAGGRRTIKKKK